ncbi:A24 family peptidase [Caulobacter sp. LARHSG274]
METDFVRLTWSTAYALLFVAAAASDVWSRKIPNWTVLGLMALFAVAIPFSWLSSSWGAALLTAVVALAAGFVLYAGKILGAGDAKLLAAAALFAGPDHLLLLLVITTIAGGVLAVMALMARPYAEAFALSWRPRLQPGVPYGVAIALGALGVGWVSGVLAVRESLVHLSL